MATGEIHIEVLDEAISVAPGDSTTMRVLVTNRGGQADDVGLRIVGDGADLAAIEPSTLVLAAGGSAVASLIIAAPVDHVVGPVELSVLASSSRTRATALAACSVAIGAGGGGGRRSKRWMWVVAGAGAAALVLVLALVVPSSGSSKSSQASASHSGTTSGNLDAGSSTGSSSTSSTSSPGGSGGSSDSGAGQGSTSAGAGSSASTGGSKGVASASLTGGTGGAAGSVTTTTTLACGVGNMIATGGVDAHFDTLNGWYIGSPKNSPHPQIDTYLGQGSPNHEGMPQPPAAGAHFAEGGTFSSPPTLNQGLIFTGSLYQFFNLTACQEALASSGHAYLHFGAWIGGWQFQNDTVNLSVEFYNSGGAPACPNNCTFTLNGPTAADRANGESSTDKSTWTRMIHWTYPSGASPGPGLVIPKDTTEMLFEPNFYMDTSSATGGGVDSDGSVDEPFAILNTTP